MCNDWDFLLEFAIDVGGETELLNFFQSDVLGVDFHVELGMVDHDFVDPGGVLVREHVLLVFVVLGREWALGGLGCFVVGVLQGFGEVFVVFVFWFAKCV